MYSQLERLGLLNFGATTRLTMRLRTPPLEPRKTIVVVGAGLAGLGAASQLRRFGHRVLILEAQSRVGGRVLTEYVGETPIDLGAMLIVGTQVPPSTSNPSPSPSPRPRPGPNLHLTLTLAL